ncbi:MAG: hypothetical protein KatS3mg105_0085 [Gemmatales bacterium]|nr:MAG: hypothetical protein KatS3mg105_0085 [Gemmatales bacterium]
MSALGFWNRSFLVFLFLLAPIVPVSGDEAAQERLRQDVRVLSSPAFEGRGVATKGINLAADYIADQFKKIGVRPAGDDGGYFQHFTMYGATLRRPLKLLLTGPQGQRIELVPGKHFEVLGMSAPTPGTIATGLVFAGYGISADKPLAYDDYKDIEVKGKAVIVLRDAPRIGNRFAPFGGNDRQTYASFTNKMQTAIKNQAAAILFVSDYDTAKDGDELLPFSYLATVKRPPEIPAVHLRRSVLDGILRSNGTSLRDLEKQIDADLKPRSSPLTGWQIELTITLERGNVLPVKNVIGVLEGKGPLARESVIIGAHYDHLGYGGPRKFVPIEKSEHSLRCRRQRFGYRCFIGNCPTFRQPEEPRRSASCLHCLQC